MGEGGNVKGLRQSCCLNGKVIVGLVVVGLGVRVVAPNLVGAAVPLLLTAICPLSMLAMAVSTGRGRGMRHATRIQTPDAALDDLPTLQARRAAIARDIAWLDGGVSPVVREAAAPASATHAALMAGMAGGLSETRPMRAAADRGQGGQRTGARGG